MTEHIRVMMAELHKLNTLNETLRLMTKEWSRSMRQRTIVLTELVNQVEGDYPRETMGKHLRSAIDDAKEELNE